MQSELTGRDRVPHFSVVAAALPAAGELSDEEVVAISCGRERNNEPKASTEGGNWIGLPKGAQSTPHGSFVVEWAKLERSFGIIARDERMPGDDAVGSADLRSFQAVQKAFLDFLRFVGSSKKYRGVHVQLLAAGGKKAFPPWVSLVQMARAFGAWARANEDSELSVSVYVVDPDVLRLLRAGHLDLSFEIAGVANRITVEVVDRMGRRTRQFVFSEREETLGALAERVGVFGNPRISVRPSVRGKLKRNRLNRLNAEPVESHAISGSTVVFDFSQRQLP